MNKIAGVRLTCPECDRFFGFENIKQGEIKLKCPNCKNWVVVKATLKTNLDNNVKSDNNEKRFGGSATSPITG